MSLNLTFFCIKLDIIEVKTVLTLDFKYCQFVFYF